VLARPPDRSLAAIADCLDALVRYDEVEAGADAGEPVQVAELLLLDHALGALSLADFERRAPGVLEGATAEQRTALDRVRADLVVWDLVGASMEGDEGRRRAVDGMLALLETGARPSPTGKYAGNFWSTLAQHAQEVGDADLCRRCAAGMRADFPGDEQRVGWAERLEQLARGIDERDALVARRDAGETGLEAQILLLEVRLEIIGSAALRERLASALRDATPEEREELLQADVDFAVREAWTESFRPGGLERAGPVLYELLTGDGRRPSKMLHREGWRTLGRFALTQDDGELLARCAAGLRKAFPADEALAQLAARIEERAASGAGGRR
jgi:hypothetical protein